METLSLLECDAVSIDKQLPKFRRIVVPSPYELNMNSHAERLDIHMYSCITKPFFLDCLTRKLKALRPFETSAVLSQWHSGTSQKNPIYSHTTHCFPFACGDDVQTVKRGYPTRGPRAAATTVNNAYTCYINYTII